MKRIRKHVSLDDLEAQISQIRAELEASDNLQFGKIHPNGFTDEHDHILAINRQLNAMKNLFLKREKESVNDAYAKIVKQIAEANHGDMEKTTAILKRASQSVTPSSSAPQAPQNTNDSAE